MKLPKYISVGSNHDCHPQDRHYAGRTIPTSDMEEMRYNIYIHEQLMAGHFGGCNIHSLIAELIIIRSWRVSDCNVGVLIDKSCPRPLIVLKLRHRQHKLPTYRLSLSTRNFEAILFRHNKLTYTLGLVFSLHNRDIESSGGTKIERQQRPSCRSSLRILNKLAIHARESTLYRR
jgi:hypothetical protein